MGELGICSSVLESLSSANFMLVHHLTIARPTLLFIHAECLPVAIQAVSKILLPLDRIIVLGGSTSVPSSQLSSSYQSFDDLIQRGSLLPPVTVKPFKKGEAKTRIAFLAPSSGTTGVQKVNVGMVKPHTNTMLCLGSSHFSF